ncbi:MAG: hypothetical protein A2W25_07195 [candidate division Zixibacteria bacterium RBG_16_53_22]|nr:MAG: hypothetical protein A2W25_07195 [candidate division Zixibacteria bacterium RBG_16_53_22]
MKLLLIDPVTTSGVLDVRTRRKLREGIGYPGIGLITVAALTPPDIRVTVIDESVEDIDLNCPADLVGISVQAPIAAHAYKLSAHFRQRGIPTVLGGIHVSLNPDEAMPHADSILLGEAEITWPELIEDFLKGDLKKIYKPDRLADLDKTPCPRRDLLDKDCYQLPSVVQASKGCQYGCEFCSLYSYLGHTRRYRDPVRVADEIRGLDGDLFLFADDNIYSSRKYSINLFKTILDCRKRWVAESTWHIAFDNEALTWASRSGCVGLFIGFDTINQQPYITKVPKSDEVEDIYIRAIRNIQSHGIAVVAAFVFGLDNDDESVFERSLRVVREGGANLVNFSALVPYPGTPIFQRLDAQGRITERDWSKYISPNVCYEPGKMSRSGLEAGIRWAQSEFYTMGNILHVSWETFKKLGWAMALLSLQLNMSQKRNWGKGSAR